MVLLLPFLLINSLSEVNHYSRFFLVIYVVNYVLQQDITKDYYRNKTHQWLDFSRYWVRMSTDGDYFYLTTEFWDYSSSKVLPLI